MRIKVDDLLDITAAYDPAGSKSAIKRVGARAAVVVVGQAPSGHIAVLHAWAARATTMVQVDQVLRANELWRPRIFGCERNGMGEHQGPHIYEEAKRRGQVFPMKLFNQPSTIDKPTRIRQVLQPIIADGRLLVPLNFYELRAELETFPMCLTFDLIDMLAEAIHLLPRRVAVGIEHTETAALRRYLQDAGHDQPTIAAITGPPGVHNDGPSMVASSLYA
jgi:hypothetical protein